MNKYIIIKELVDNKINNKQASIKLRMSVRTIIEN
jgi:hypothetical protein